MTTAATAATMPGVEGAVTSNSIAMGGQQPPQQQQTQLEQQHQQRQPHQL